tara:strand:+ start:5581 stop:6240 length:660 start_codon:yes stop_codon:yes gene_type:complete
MGAVSMDRRQALKVIAIAAATPTLVSCKPSEEAPEALLTSASTSNPKARGDAWDPDLLAPTVLWERSLTSDELQSLAVLCDVIIPADDRSQSASQLGAHDFIDEWVSAPYEANQSDKIVVREGLVWLDSEAVRRFGEATRFRDLAPDQRIAICDEICYLPNARPELEAAALFFDKVRDLTSTAFWTTPEGMEDLQYVGNVPLPRWDPPPLEVLRHIGLE